MTVAKVQKRNGEIVNYDSVKITKAIFAAAQSVGGKNQAKADDLTRKVESVLKETYRGNIPAVEDIQDVVEKILIEEGHAKTAKAYILYRKRHEEIREVKNLFMDAEEMIEDYVNLDDWRVNENANMSFSLQGLNNHIVENITKKYWLNKIYDKNLRDSHIKGDLHIHDLGLLAPYCCGWDLEAFLEQGFKGAQGKVESRPPKHFESALGQLVNLLYTLQGEAAGAQAVSSIDTYLAPFIHYDGLDYTQVKKSLQRFVFNLNVPTRVGFQTPFTNVTLDIAPHPLLTKQPVKIAGALKDKNYGEFQEEMDMFNQAFCEVMMEGDGAGRAFSFPIPTINITKDFPWHAPVVNSIMEMTRKFGTPYFANFLNSDLAPEDVRSMCCRLRLDNRELRKRGGGLFGANPLTGSINVVTLNMARIGYLATSEEEFKKEVRLLMEKSREICDAKRVMLEKYMEAGLYPYSKFYLQGVKDNTGEYFKNHFSTIGLIGMNEALLNFLGEDITTEKGRSFAMEVLEFMRDRLVHYQEETGNLYNLEATPGEGASYRQARVDKEKYPDIITAGTESRPYYTNSVHPPVGYTNDPFELLDIQDDLQSAFTGGTVVHLFLGEKVSDPEAAKNLVKRVFDNYHLPYITITPTFSICQKCGYIKGEVYYCSNCEIKGPTKATKNIEEL